MTEPTHPLARLKEAAVQWLRSTPGGMLGEVFRLSMRVSLSEPPSVDDVRLRPEMTPEDLRYEIAEWSAADVTRGKPVEILGRAAGLDGARALLEAEHRKAPKKVLILSEKMRVIDRRGTGTDGGR